MLCSYGLYGYDKELYGYGLYVYDALLCYTVTTCTVMIRWFAIWLWPVMACAIMIGVTLYTDGL